MITTFLKWSLDMTKAPRGEMVTSTYQTMVKGKPHEATKTEHVPVKILALTNCGKVVSTYWMPGKKTASGGVLDAAKWSGLATGEDPVLWAPWPDAAELKQTLSDRVFASAQTVILEGAEQDA